MQKSDWYKILAIGFVAVFLFEMIAIGALNNNSAPNGGGSQSLPTLNGEASENITLVRYEPYLMATGSGAAIEQAKAKLLSSGVATYEVPSTGGFVLNLRSGSDVPSAASELEEANATVLANAVISTPSTITVVGDALTVKAQGASFNMQLRPIYPEGSQIPARFVAYVENGQLVSIGGMMLQSAYVAGARVEATLEGVSLQASLEIPWENRSAAKLIAREEGAAFSEKSYIIIVGTATQGQLNATKEAASAFSTGISGGIISVRNDFEDKARAQADLAATGLAFEFPPSLASFANDTNGTRAEALRARLASGGIAAMPQSKALMKLKFPSSFEWQGANYNSEGYEVEIEGMPPAGASSVWLEIDFETTGGRVGRIASVRVSQDQGAPVLPEGNSSQAAANATAAPYNSS